MALWDNLSRKASETTAKAVQQAKLLAETAKLNGTILEEEKKINNLYCQIGKLYVEQHQRDCEEGFAGMIAAIAESEQKIKECRAQIQGIKGVVCCEGCGAEVAKGSAFCSSCGKPISVPAAEEAPAEAAPESFEEESCAEEETVQEEAAEDTAEEASEG